MYEFSTLAVKERIQAETLAIGKISTERWQKRARIAPAPTHSEIASRVATHREAVTRELSRLARMGLIERTSGALVVEDVERLAELVHSATGE